MNLTELDAYTLATDGSNVFMFKELNEEVFNMQMKLKNLMDQGLGAEDFEKAQALKEACDKALESLDLLQD